MHQLQQDAISAVSGTFYPLPDPAPQESAVLGFFDQRRQPLELLPLGVCRVLEFRPVRLLTLSLRPLRVRKRVLQRPAFLYIEPPEREGQMGQNRRSYRNHLGLRASPPARPPVLHPTAIKPQDLNRPPLAGVTQQRREFVTGPAFRFYVA